MGNPKFKLFKFSEVFDLVGGFFSKKPDLTEGGEIPYFSGSSNNYGISSSFFKNELLEEYADEKITPIYKNPAICVTNNGSVGFAYFIDRDFTCSQDVTVLYTKHHTLNQYTGNFIVTLIEMDKFRWGYGRKWKISKMKNSLISLPIKDDETVDWKYIEKYMKSIAIRRPKTKIEKRPIIENIDAWCYFKLTDLFVVSYGHKLDLNKQTVIDEKRGIRFISRDSKNNGIVAYIERIEDLDPFPAGAITIALGGSRLGTAFLQDKPFYTAQNLAVLLPKEGNIEKITIFHKLFLLPIIRFETKKKFFAFGRELNTHIKRDFAIKLPAKNGQPDWDYIESFMKGIPYSDCLHKK